MDADTKAPISSMQSGSGKARLYGSSQAGLKERSSNKPYKEMSYREKPATPNSPSGSSVTTVYDHLLSPSSPAEEEEKDERVRNDLLDEICSDMGFDDNSMDLDFDDFCYQSAQQQTPTAGQRLPSLTTPAKASKGTDSESRRSSTLTASSGYSTSDSLCAMAKLTQSISSEAPAANHAGPQKAESEPSEHSMKQEPEPEDSDGDSSPYAKETDQGKALTARLAQRQRSETTPYTAPRGTQSPNTLLKRRRSVHESSVTTESELPPPSCASGDLQQAGALGGMAQVWSQQQYNPQSRTAPCDYSYQDDFTMEDMTAPDTMINFSEMPQQPNYYQQPQSSVDNLNLPFSMSLSSGPQCFAAPQHQQQQPYHQPFGRTAGSTTTVHSAGPHGPAMSPRSQSMRGSAAATMSLSPFHGQGAVQQSLNHPFPGFQSQVAASTANPIHTQQGFRNQEPFPSTPTGGPPNAHQMPPSSVSSPLSHSLPMSKSTPGSSIASHTSYHSSQQGFMQRLVTDKSSAFRSHPLFPLLRDLIIADMNFHEPSFPHQLILNLPSDFNKLLKNYLSRNPPRGNYQSNQSVESVVMDALKYAHHTLIQKIQQKKGDDSPAQQNAMSSGPSPGELAPSAVNDYCEKFEDSVRQNMQQQSQQLFGRPGVNMQHSPSAALRQPRLSRTADPGFPNALPMQTPTYNLPLSVDTSSTGHGAASPQHCVVSAAHMGPPPAPQQYHGQQYPSQPGFNRPVAPPAPPRNTYIQQGGPPCPPPNYTVSPSNPPVPRQHQGMYDMPVYPSGLQDSPHFDPNGYGCMPPPAHNPRLHQVMGERHLLYMNNINDGSLVKTMMEGGKDMYGDMSDSSSVMSGHGGPGKGGQNSQGKGAEGRKHASLPKEAVNIMLNWLREHQDKPYPNDDEKGMLIKQTGLSITQINYWFTNARRRLLPKWRGEDM